MSAACRRAGDTDNNFATAVGDTTGGQPEPDDPGHCGGVLKYDQVVHRAAFCRTSRMQSTPTPGESSCKGEMQIDSLSSSLQKRRAPENEGGCSPSRAIGEAIRGELQEVRKDIRHFAKHTEHGGCCSKCRKLTGRSEPGWSRLREEEGQDRPQGAPRPLHQSGGGRPRLSRQSDPGEAEIRGGAHRFGEPVCAGTPSYRLTTAPVRPLSAYRK